MQADCSQVCVPLPLTLPFNGKPGSVLQMEPKGAGERKRHRPHLEEHGSSSFAHAALMIRQFLVNILCCSMCPARMKDADVSGWGILGFCTPLVRTAAGAGWDMHPVLQPASAFPSLLQYSILHQTGHKSSQTLESPFGTFSGGRVNL